MNKTASTTPRVLAALLAIAVLTIAGLLIAWDRDRSAEASAKDDFCNVLAADVAFLEEGLARPGTSRYFSPLAVRAVMTGANYCVAGQREQLDEIGLHLRTTFSVISTDTDSERQAKALAEARDLLQELRAMVQGKNGGDRTAGSGGT